MYEIAKTLMMFGMGFNYEHYNEEKIKCDVGLVVYTSEGKINISYEGNSFENLSHAQAVAKVNEICISETE